MTTKAYAVTVVKSLRTHTENWDNYPPTPSQAMVVKTLVERLPSFRAAPQTKTENTLRAIEALLAMRVGDMTKKKIPNVLVITDCEMRDLVVAICRIVNVHHGVVASQPFPELHPPKTPNEFAEHAKKAEQAMQAKVEAANKLMAADKVAKVVIAEQEGSPLAGTAFYKKTYEKKAKLSDVTNDPTGEGDF